MEQLDRIVIQSLGLVKPWQRFAFGLAVGSAATYAVQPDTMFLADGTARPWAVLAPESPQATSLPWFAPGLVAGGLLATFI